MGEARRNNNDDDDDGDDNGNDDKNKNNSNSKNKNKNKTQDKNSGKKKHTKRNIRNLVQRGVAGAVADVHVRPAPEDGPEDGDVPVEGGGVQRREVVRGAEVEVGAGGQQRLRDGQPVSPGRPQQRRAQPVAESVLLCPPEQEREHDFGVPAYCRPVQRRALEPPAGAVRVRAADQQLVDEPGVAPVGGLVQHGAAVDAVLGAHVRPGQHQAQRRLLVPAHGCRVQSRPLGRHGQHVHVRLSSRPEQGGHHARIPADGGRVEQGTAPAAPVSRAPVGPGTDESVDEVQVAAGGGVLEGHPQPLCPLLRCGTIGDHLQDLARQSLQQQGRALGVDVHVFDFSCAHNNNNVRRG